MTRAFARLGNTTSLKSGIHPFPGQPVHNLILGGLPRREREAVAAKLQFIEFPTHCVLNEIAGPIRYGYFIDSGLASILNVTSEGKSVEVGLTGKEGFVGLPLIVGFDTSPTRAVTQIAGTAFRVSARDLKSLFRDCPQLLKLLHRYSQEFALQITQVAACNRLHRVDQRLARWFLMSQDRLGGSSFLLTQEFLSHMLGTRRASVTTAAGVLHKAGFITYRRGKVTIEDRAGLEKAACGCYASLTRQLKQWRGKPR
ncbi:MAG: Crp/Fnr family transcriptional regulator [Acidobacteriia bacterium]|nr:Crp/Fnr family transcriptional regulator [Terriglobia bacterium]